MMNNIKQMSNEISIDVRQIHDIVEDEFNQSPILICSEESHPATYSDELAPQQELTNEDKHRIMWDYIAQRVEFGIEAMAATGEQLPWPSDILEGEAIKALWGEEEFERMKEWKYCYACLDCGKDHSKCPIHKKEWTLPPKGYCINDHFAYFDDFIYSRRYKSAVARAVLIRDLEWNGKPSKFGPDITRQKIEEEKRQKWEAELERKRQEAAKPKFKYNSSGFYGSSQQMNNKPQQQNSSNNSQQRIMKYKNLSSVDSYCYFVQYFQMVNDTNHFDVAVICSNYRYRNKERSDLIKIFDGLDYEEPLYVDYSDFTPCDGRQIYTVRNGNGRKFIREAKNYPEGCVAIFRDANGNVSAFEGDHTKGKFTAGSNFPCDSETAKKIIALVECNVGLIKPDELTKV